MANTLVVLAPVECHRLGWLVALSSAAPPLTVRIAQSVGSRFLTFRKLCGPLLLLRWYKSTTLDGGAGETMRSDPAVYGLEGLEGGRVAVLTLPSRS